MIFGVRCSVDLLDIEGSLSGYRDIPVEVALPYKCVEFLTQMERMPELQEYLLRQHLRVTSIHATQGRLTGPDFMDWAVPAVRLAQAVGARVAVFHPESAAKIQRANSQMISLQNIRRLQREAGDVAVGIESFGGSKVILWPEEIRDRKLYLVLDTTHLFAQRSYDLIETYAAGIPLIHLSEPPSLATDTPHMPVGPVCARILTRLRELRWRGNITLEYMPQYQRESFRDRQMLDEEFGE